MLWVTESNIQPSLHLSICSLMHSFNNIYWGSTVCQAAKAYLWVEQRMPHEKCGFSVKEKMEVQGGILRSKEELGRWMGLGIKDRKILYHCEWCRQGEGLRPLFLFMYFHCIWKAERQREWAWEREKKTNPPSAESMPKCPQQLGLCQAEARSPELNLGLSHGWQGSKYLSCLPGCTFIRNWIRGGGARAGSRHSDMAHGCPREKASLHTLGIKAGAGNSTLFCACSSPSPSLSLPTAGVGSSGWRSLLGWGRPWPGCRADLSGRYIMQACDLKHSSSCIKIAKSSINWVIFLLHQHIQSTISLICNHCKKITNKWRPLFHTYHSKPDAQFALWHSFSLPSPSATF